MIREGEFHKYADGTYDPIKIGSIDGTDVEPHDRAVVRAIHSEYVPNKQVRGDPDCTVFVGRLNPRTSQVLQKRTTCVEPNEPHLTDSETIYAEFSKLGKIKHCRLVKDIVTGKSKQYAFLEYEMMSSVERALREMHKEYLDGMEIVVEREAERRLAGWKPRRLGGGFGGKKESGQLRFGCRERPFRKPILITNTYDQICKR